MIKVRSIVVRGLIIFMSSTIFFCEERLLFLNLAKLSDSNHCNGIVYVEDIDCNGQLTVVTGRWE